MITLKDCPEYWGGYSFVPYYFEFWEGMNLDLIREVYEMRNDGGNNSFYNHKMFAKIDI